MQKLTQEGELLTKEGGDIMEESIKHVGGIVVSEGVAMAKAYHYKARDFEIRRQKTSEGEANEQWLMFRDASEKAKKQLWNMAECAKTEEDAALFHAHIQLLADEKIVFEIRKAIQEEHLYAEAAVEMVYTSYEALFLATKDELLAARAADIQDVKNRLLHCLSGTESRDLSHLPEDVIVICGELMPSVVATMDRMRIKGVISQRGGYNSHSAIMLRSYGIPAIFAARNAMSAIPNEAEVILNATEGYYIPNPEIKDAEEFTQLKKTLEEQRTEMEKFRRKPCVLKDGTTVEIGLNIESADYDNTEGLFDFVGLVRTEFLYMSKDRLPDEEEQFDIYKKIVERAGGRQVTLRTLDIGGDKRLPGVKIKESEGLSDKRGLKFCLEHRDLFLVQLRAALRASAFGPLQIMFPMVEHIEDIAVAKECIEQAKTELKERGIGFDEHIPVGIMIEVPKIAKQAETVAALVDFASVGTNDLAQAMCCFDRHQMTVDEYYQSDNKEMRKLLQGIFKAFDKAGKAVSVCGEMAGNPKMAKTLVELGARRLSMNAAGIGIVKAHLTR